MAADGSLNFDVRLFTKGFINGLKNVGAGLDRIKGVLGSVASVAGVAFSTAGLISFIKASEEAYKVQLEAETKLETILGRNLGATKEQIKATKEWANALQKVGVIGDEIQLSGLQELSTYIENADSLKTMNEVLNDMLAQQYGLNATAESAVTISTMLGKVLEGQTSALSRYGYSFTEAQEQLLKYGTEEQRVATLADVVRASVGGVNEALARTPAGRIKQLSNAFGDVKERIGEAFTNLEYMLLPATEHLVEMLAKAADYAVKLTETLAATFGIELHNTVAVTGEIADSIEEQEALTEAVEDTAKAQDNYLAGFDKITKLGDDTADKPDKAEETVAETIIPELSDGLLVESAQEAADKVQEIFQGLLDVLAPLQEAWEKYGDSIEQHLSNNFNNIGSHIRNMINATTEWASELDWEPLLKSFDGLLEALEPITEDIGAGLEWLWVNVLLPLGKWTIEEATPKAIDVLSGALDVLAAMVDAVKPGLEEFWDKVLKPLLDKAAELTIEGLEKLSNWLHDLADWIREHPNISGFMTELAAAIGILYAAIKGGVVANIAKFITAAAALDVTIWVVIAGILAWIYVITELKDNWQDICDVFEESGGVWEFLTGWIEYATDDIEGFFSTSELGKKWLETWENVGAAFYTVINSWWDAFETFGEKIYDITHKLGRFLADRFRQAYSDVIKPFKPMVEWFKEKWKLIKDIYNAASPYFKEKFDKAAENVRSAFSSIGSFFSDMANKVKAPFLSIANWFKETFSQAWQNVLNVFSRGGSVFEGIQAGIDTIFKQTVNGLINGINNTLRRPFETVNTAINALRGWELWTPWGDFYPFNWLPTINIPEIPRLAQGTAVPANYGEFLAVLGDNKREPEVVSPLSTIKKAVSEALQEAGGTGGDITVNLRADLDGKQIYKTVVRLNKDSIRMTGKNPLQPEVVR
ncbi:MAG: hypothetical protein K5695_12945 [Oscillospiraceae bacterium]|nr:hypothetical protein [Oscillospiraceae bacterium]